MEIEDCYSLSLFCELVSGCSGIHRTLKDTRIRKYMYIGVIVSVVKGIAQNYTSKRTAS